MCGEGEVARTDVRVECGAKMNGVAGLGEELTAVQHDGELHGAPEHVAWEAEPTHHAKLLGAEAVEVRELRGRRVGQVAVAQRLCGDRRPDHQPAMSHGQPQSPSSGL